MIFSGYIYGVPPKGNEHLILEVVALNLLTYEYGLLRLNINITEPQEDKRATQSVKLKVHYIHK